MKHTVTKRDMQAVKIGVVMASSSERGGKRLVFTYDIGRKRLEYMVFSGKATDPGHAFDDLDDAIAAYNEL